MFQVQILRVLGSNFVNGQMSDIYLKRFNFITKINSNKRKLWIIYKLSFPKVKGHKKKQQNTK